MKEHSESRHAKEMKEREKSTSKKSKMFEEPGKMDPTGMMSDETYIRGMSSDNPKRKELMNKYKLEDEEDKPGIYGSSRRNFT